MADLPEENTTKSDETTNNNGRPSLAWGALGLLEQDAHICEEGGLCSEQGRDTMNATVKGVK